MPEVALYFFMKNLIVAYSGLEERIPIHQPLSAANKSFFEKTKEGFSYGFFALGIESEPGSVPITACSNITQLPKNPLLVLGLPVPDAFDEFLTPEIMP